MVKETSQILQSGSKMADLGQVVLSSSLQISTAISMTISCPEFNLHDCQLTRLAPTASMYRAKGFWPVLPSRRISN